MKIIKLILILMFILGGFNPYDCYAEVCFKKEKLNLALLNYKKSLKINPENSNAEKMITIVKEKLAEKQSHQ